MAGNNESSKSTPSEKLEANKVSVKIPPFWVDKPEMWFYQVVLSQL